MRNKKLVLFLSLIFPSLFVGAESSRELDFYGEKIGYVLKAGFITIGRVDIEYHKDTLNCGGYVEVNARSTGIVNFIKDVHYRFDACYDPAIGHAIRSSRYIKEGSYIDVDEVNYFRDVITDSLLVTTEDNDSIVVQSDIYDILIAFFHFRGHYINSKLEEGKTTYIKTFFVDGEWPLNIKYVGKEKIDTDLGEARCYKFLPETEVGRYFKTKEDMTMWVTSNKYLIPVKIEARLKIATLTAEIETYQRPDKFKTTKNN